MTQRAYKFRIYPTKSQATQLAKTFGCVRLYWNHCVHSWKNYQPGDTFETATEFRNSEDRPWMLEVSAAAIQQKQRDFEQYKRQKFSKTRKITLGNPAFKKKNGKQSFRLPVGKFAIKNNYIQLEKIGKVRAIFDRVIPNGARLVNVTISQNSAGQHFASILVEEIIQPKPKTGKNVGIDVGLKSFAVTSEHELPFDNPRFYRKNQAKIARLQMFQSKKREER